LGIYRVQDTTKEEFVVNVIQVECNIAIYTLLIMQQGLQMQQLLIELNTGL
jgi:hypothetical protein